VKQPEAFEPVKKVPNFFQKKIAYPLLKTPDAGHTTFTLQITNGKLSGFYEPPEQTKDLKELLPVIKGIIPKTKTYLKTHIKQIKEQGLKNELKTLPKKIITPIKKINLKTLTNIPKKIRDKLSSD
jgi:hypothetical protein